MCKILNMENINKKFIFEACVETIQQAVKAQEQGANRIELCADLAKGGTTPSIGLIKKCSKILTIPIYVIIRPRGGDFLYSKEEVDIMLYDIDIVKKLKLKNVEGFVLGLLNDRNELDTENIEKLLDCIYKAYGIKNF